MHSAPWSWPCMDIKQLLADFDDLTIFSRYNALVIALSTIPNTHVEPYGRIGVHIRLAAHEAFLDSRRYELHNSHHIGLKTDARANLAECCGGFIESERDAVF